MKKFWSVFRNLRDRMGRRGLFLAVIGVDIVVYGFAVVTSPTPPFGTYDPFNDALNNQWSGWLWVVCGVAAVVSAPTSREGLGFAALLVPPGVWSMMFGLSWLTSLATGGVEGSVRAWGGLAAWSMLVFAVALLSGWQEPVSRNGVKT